MRGLPVAFVTAALLLAGAACTSEESPDAAASSPESATPVSVPPIEVTAREYKFTVSETLESGEATFTLLNKGKEEHELVIFKLKTDRSAEKVLKLPQKKGRKLVEEVGGTFAKPGRAATNPIRTDLTPGVYALVCFIPAPDGTPHFAKGMVEEIAVE